MLRLRPCPSGTSLCRACGGLRGPGAGPAWKALPRESPSARQQRGEATTGRGGGRAPPSRGPSRLASPPRAEPPARPEPHPLAPVMEANLRSSVALGRVVSQWANYVQVRVSELRGAVGPSGQPLSGPRDPLLRHLCNPTLPELLCTSRALLKKMDARPAVGDKVELRGVDWVEGRGVVHEILPRSSLLLEPLVANADHAIVMLAVADPPFDPEQATRFLAAAHAAGLPVTVFLNKCDLLAPPEVDEVAGEVASWGYDPVPLSVKLRVGLREALERTRGRVSVVFGPSGVGKSSLINGLRLAFAEEGGGEAYEPSGIPLVDNARPAHLVARRGEWAAPLPGLGSAAEQWEGCEGDVGEAGQEGWSRGAEREGRAGDREGLHGVHESGEEEYYEELDEMPEWYEMGGSAGAVPLLRTRQVSRQTGRGRHTTRTATLIDMPGGGLLCDTPGFNLPMLQDLSASSLEACFPEIAAVHAEDGPCQFRNCTHRHEPGCPVREAGWARYPYYVAMVDEVEEREQVEREQSMGKRRREGKVKVKVGKVGKGGAGVEEPGRRGEVRLEAKKHRRSSRRSVAQALDGLSGGAVREAEELAADEGAAERWR